MATFAAQIDPYELALFAGDHGGLGWSIEPHRCAVLVHDLLPYYVNVLGRNTREDVVGRCQTVVEWASNAGLPLIASAPRPASTVSQRGLGGKLWGQGPSADDAATSCLPALNDSVPWLLKRSLSAFYATDLEVELRRLKRDQLLICGVFASQGIVATSFDALARDIEVFVVSDAVADYNSALHRSALAQIARSTGQVVSTTGLLKAPRPEPA